MTQRVLLSLLLVLCIVSFAAGQTELINAHLVVVGSQNFCKSQVGTDSYACNLPRTITTYIDGATYAFEADVANTGAATLALNGIASPKTIKTRAGSTKIDLPTGAICIGQRVVVQYDGTDMQMLSQPCTGVSGSGTVTTGAAGAMAFYPAAAATVDDSTALLVSSTDILAESHAVTAVSASATVTASQGVFTCNATSGPVALTLPPASTTTAKRFKLSKTDSSANACGFLRAGSDTINGGTTATTTSQYGIVEVEWLTTATWGSAYGVLLGAINPQTTTYQVLPADFDAYHTITVASGTFTITLVASGGSQPAEGTYIRIINYGTGVVTIARSGQTINGAAANLTLPAGSASAPTSAWIFSDGTNYFAALAGASSGAGVTDGDKGDITVSGSGATWTVDATYAAAVASFTNKEVRPRIVSMTNATSFTPTPSTADINTQANTQGAGTLTANPVAGIYDGQKLMLRIASDAIQLYAWSTATNGYRGGLMPCPVSSSGGGLTDYIGLLWHAAATKWDCVSYAPGY